MNNMVLNFCFMKTCKYMNEIGNYNTIETIVLQILKMLSIKLFMHEFTTQLPPTKSP